VRWLGGMAAARKRCSEKQRTAISFKETAAPGPILSSVARPCAEPQTPSSALRGRQGMDIIEPRRAEALREFSRRLKWKVFIGGGV